MAGFLKLLYSEMAVHAVHCPSPTHPFFIYFWTTMHISRRCTPHAPRPTAHPYVMWRAGATVHRALWLHVTDSKAGFNGDDIPAF